MARCNLCENELAPPLYVGPEARSLTSLCAIVPGRTIVHFCGQCGHLQTQPLPALPAYYDSQYRILLDSEDEDQLYKITNGRKIFRIDQQVRTFLEKVPLAPAARVLDYGCAKGASAKKLLQFRPDISAHLFDVSSMYLPFWERFAREDQWGTHELKPRWQASFDAVMSYFVLEHVAEPVAVARRMAGLLKPGGVLYGLVPNVLANSADLIVADHVNHFSRPSLEALMERAGLRLVEIDGQAHEAGWIVTARKESADDRSAEDRSTADEPAGRGIVQPMRGNRPVLDRDRSADSSLRSRTASRGAGGDLRFGLPRRFDRFAAGGLASSTMLCRSEPLSPRQDVVR